MTDHFGDHFARHFGDHFGGGEDPRFINSSENLPYPLDKVYVNMDHGPLFSTEYNSAPFDPFK